LTTELRPRARARLLSLLIVASGLGRIVGDLVAPRVFAAGGMQSVTLMAAIVALAALIVVLTGVREVMAGSGDQADPAAITS
jgi:predicted MFS family arabinose efflux permease